MSIEKLYFIVALCAVALLPARATAQSQDLTLFSGNLLFVRSRDSEMEKAINASTGSYTHVAFVERDNNGNIWVLEADPQNGVQRIRFNDWVNDNHSQYDVYQLTEPFDTADVIARAKQLLGQRYDDAFLPDNGKLYCSELIYECFWKNGQPLFTARPMNWRDINGEIPNFWTAHFQKLGIPVPEGVLGTNPTDLARSPFLRKS